MRIVEVMHGGVNSRVRVDVYLNDMFKVIVGVNQGSVLSAVLFLYCDGSSFS